MSRYAPDYRPTRDRSRSPPPRFADTRRPSTASAYGSRASDLSRGGADAPRGPRSQFDGARPPLSAGIQSSGPGRGGYAGRNESRELRDAPPLGSERGRPFKDREYDRRDRIPSPRDRSPPRNFRDPREYPPRELDIPRARRGSRDGPPSASSAYSQDAPPFASAPFRGGFGRGRGRGDFEHRGRGGRRIPDDRELFRRERSPPPARWGRDLSRDGREPDRRDERRFERREDSTRPQWLDRERDLERSRRDGPFPRLEGRGSNESLAGSGFQGAAAPPINPERLALLESAGADVSVRRPSMASASGSARESKQPEIPAHLNGRAENMSNRYGARGSSPPTQAPPVPAFTFSISSTPQAAAPPPAPVKSLNELKVSQPSAESHVAEPSKTVSRDKPPPDAPTAPKAPAPVTASKPPVAEPPPAAPKAPRALENDNSFGSRLQGVRSWEALPSGPQAHSSRPEQSLGPRNTQPSTMPPSPNLQQGRFSSLTQAAPPSVQQAARASELGAPTGPKAARTSLGQPSVSPRPPFASPQSENAVMTGSSALPRTRTPPPPSAPSGPRNRAFSVSPKVTSSAIPTAPKAIRPPPIGQRGAERGPPPAGRGSGRPNPPQAWAPPTAPRAAQWNQWRRPGAPPMHSDKTVPAKRDFLGEEKARFGGITDADDASSSQQKIEDDSRAKDLSGQADRMDIDEPVPRKFSASGGHSAQQSFFGKPVEKMDEETSTSDAADEALSSSEEDDLEVEDPALFEAKHERQKRELEAQLVDLSSREVRGTTPLEQIARLSKITMKDVERFRERDQTMDIDEQEHTHGALAQPVTHSSESDEAHDIVTPRDEDGASVLIQDGEDGVPAARHFRRPSPEVVSLPYLLKDQQTSFQDSEELRISEARRSKDEGAIMAALDDEMYDHEGQQESLESEFEQHYRRWKAACEAMERERQEEEVVERQISIEPGPEPEAPSAMPLNPIVEGRRLHKFSSEYDVEQVLKQSEETARLEQERADREAKKVQADMEKEAIIPDQMTAEEIERSLFIDNNRLRDPADLTKIFAYIPPADDFTEHEQQIFIAAYKESPKKWSEIASLLPNREPKDCIRHYYANKWDGRFKDNRRKRGGGKRGRGGKAPRGKGSAAMADLSRSEDLVQTSESGRPKRAAAPTNFGEREIDAKNALQNQSPAKKPGTNGKQDNGEATTEKPVKRRRGAGEKPGRKAKNAPAQQPLHQLAAAPSASPNPRFIQSIPTKEEPPTEQSLEDASLLAGLHSGHRNIPTQAHPVYIQENYAPPPLPVEELDRPKPIMSAPVPTAKPSASSYWSVPEQSDFVKYIGHFGRDFTAIAAHMGTKTATMIKNHYQRQIDGGNRVELEQAAQEADARRERGENLGRPPTPTPINKRKYDAPAPALARPLPTHVDAMDVDEPAPLIRAQVPKHASPPQFQQMQQRFTTSAQATPVQAPRRIPSPSATPVSSATPAIQNPATSRNIHQPLGSRMSIFGENRPESRSGFGSVSFRASQQPTPTTQLTQSSRTVQDAHDLDFIKNLKAEQERAIRQQGAYHEQERQERIEPFQRRPSLQQQQQTINRSPSTHMSGPLQERKPPIEQRAATPPRGLFQTGNSLRRSMGSPAFGTLASAPAQPLPGRMIFDQPPLKREETRPNSVLSATSAPAPASTPAPVSEAPKRSNLLSILNSEPEEPKAAPPKPSNEQQRTASPAHAHQHPLAAPPTTQASIGGMREPFGQSGMAPAFQRPPFGQSTAGPSPRMIKQEIPAGMVGSQQQQQPPLPKQDWASRMLGQSTHASQSVPPPSSSAAPALERDVRPYFSHRPGPLGALNGPPRGNPSPPPHTVFGHSRTPSLTTQGPGQPPREQRGFMQSQGQAQGPSASQSLQSNPYSQPPPPFGSAPPAQAQNHAHHVHNNSMGGAFGQHSRGMSRDEPVRPDAPFALHSRDDAWRRMAVDERRMEERRVLEDQRLQEERRLQNDQQRRIQEDRRLQEDRRMQDIDQRRMQEERMVQEDRHFREERHAADLRQREAQYMAQREHEQRQQAAFGRGPPPPPPQPMQPPQFAGGYEAVRPPTGMGSLREQSMREAQDALTYHHQEQERMRQDAAYREREDLRRRHDEAMFPQRGTPSGPGGFRAPPPPGPGSGPGRR